MTKEYIAGFFDGEGSVTHNGKGYRVTISQTSKPVLENIWALTSTGYIFKAKKRQEHWKESWVYYIAKQEDAYRFLKLIHPFLIVKKRMVAQVLKRLKPVLKHIDEKDKLAQHRRKQTVLLRNQGLTYRAIGKKLGIDWSYARRLIRKQTKSS